MLSEESGVLRTAPSNPGERGQDTYAIAMVTIGKQTGGNGAGHAHADGDPFDCPLFRMLPSELQEQSQARPHLWSYLHALRVDEVGIPEYAPVLGQQHRQMAKPNVVYPADKNIFVHVLRDPNDVRDSYHPIEPNTAPGMEELAEQVDLMLADLVDPLKNAEDPEERGQLMADLVEDICVVDAGNGSRLGRLFSKRGRGKIRVSPGQLVALKYLVVRDKVGMGRLEPMLLDPYIEDVSCSGVGPLFVEHKFFGGLKSSVTFETTEELDRFVIQLSEKIGRPVTFREPIVDAILPDGSRVNIVFGGEISKRGSNFTIRKFSEIPLSVLELIDTGSLNYQVAAYLSFMLRERMNIFVSGETASGKTTLLNALTTFINPNAKIVTIEDTPEVQLPHPNWTREVVRGSAKETTAASVTMMDLLKASLRQRPDQVIIGEIRGEEGAIAFQAMQTGSPVMATFHASSVEKLIQRLTGEPINIPRTYVDILNCVVITSTVALPNGTPVRRIMSVNEIISYDATTDSFSFVEIFRWNAYSDQHEFVGYQNSYLLEQVIAPKRGISPNNRRRIYGELEQRAQVLKKLHQTEHTSFYDFYNILSKAYREGLLR